MKTISQLLKAKLHRIKITEACLDYEGSLTLDPDDMEAVGILPYEKILCANVENGNRFETYAIEGKRGSHVCCLNGAAAHKGKVGDNVVLGRPRCRDMPLSVRFRCACLDSILRDTSSGGFEYTYAILYYFSIDKVL